MIPADAALDALATGLWSRLRDVVLAEERLERFNFAPDAAAPVPQGDWVRRLATDEAALAGSALDLIQRAMAAGADPLNHRILRLLVAQEQPIPLFELARAAGLPPLSVAERVSELAQVGLATRVLAEGAAAVTPAGSGWVRLLGLVTDRVAAAARTALPGLA